MKHFRINKSVLQLLIAFATIGIFSACSDDGDSKTTGGEFVITGGINGENFNNSYYSVAFNDIMSGSLSFIGEDMLQMGYFSYSQIDDKIFCAGGLGATGLYVIEKDAAGNLNETASLATFNNSIQDVVKGDNSNVVAIEMSSSSDIVRLHLINTSSLEISSTVDTQVSELSDLTGPSFSGMVVSGDYVFVSYYISDPNTFATTSTDKAEVAVFNYPELTFVKVMEDSRVGPIGGFGTKAGLIKDESGNVYATSGSNPANGFSQFTKPSGILKINAGETEFDTDFFFDIEDVTGGYNTSHLVYLGDGKVFTEINTAVRSEQVIWSDSPLQTAILDLNSETINYIDGIPEHAGIGRKLEAVSIVDGSNIYMSIPEDNSIYVYRINTSDYTAVRGAEIEANFIGGIYKL
ncbi:DUF4374 domain-containing protein [Carboxylicivirga linearis]|uniref:DUF4374 domain-containing protein n=1 Tax=Carboxylicivirga linearis TaxID=1628157 RepID=A0ABS5JVA4_9BACT|nr:DUF4374 domain-containing protein [Carboxylicivirga linearis]MBS2098758.1 DUF4374 domain-containing protein [Carboxylicivirga linearis]